MSSLAQIYRAIANERRRLDRQEKAASARLARSYNDSLAILVPLLDDLTARIHAKRLAGEPVTPGWLFQEARCRHLMSEARDQARELALITGDQALATTEASVRLATEHALELLGMTAPDPDGPGIGGGFSGINEAALETITAQLGPGSPLVAILAEFPGDAERALRDGLVRGVALGLGADEIGRSLKQAMGKNLVRANLIVRTEIHRAHREATRATFRSNSQHLNGWIWMADLSPRTCVACFAMHGSKHSLDEPMGTHPACRCQMAPWTKSFAELGISIDPALETRLEVPTGEEVFRRLQPWQQRAVLGPGAYELYRSGARLGDFVKVSTSEKWGVNRSVRSNQDVARLRGVDLKALGSGSSGGGSGNRGGRPPDNDFGGEEPPTAPWEDRQYRTRIPDRVIQAIGTNAVFLGVPRRQARKILHDHPTDAPYLADLNAVLERASRWGVDPGRPHQVEVYANMTADEWVILVFNMVAKRHGLTRLSTMYTLDTPKKRRLIDDPESRVREM